MQTLSMKQCEEINGAILVSIPLASTACTAFSVGALGLMYAYPEATAVVAEPIGELITLVFNQLPTIF